MKITCRKMQKTDYQEIKKLIIQAWFSEYKFSNKIKGYYASAYLRLYLSESNYRIVVCDNDNVIAFLFGRHRKVNFFEKYYNLFLLLVIKFFFLFSKPGRRKNKILKKTKKVNNTLYKKYKKVLFNELVLFIVEKKYQGYGIGTKLENDFSNYLKEKGEEYVYLFSDTYSNYQFYKKKGYIKGGELEVDFDIEGEREETCPKYFIYYKELSYKKNS
ncbi:MAG: GNAT family N-acetyltransferase [Spirochaetaceae bacterium]|nr:GNAT family N-acetyltransferase [Spirochaetaceae bacterium]